MVAFNQFYGIITKVLLFIGGVRMANQKSGGRFLKKNVRKRQALSQAEQKQVPVKAHKQTAALSKTVMVFTILTICVCLVASAFFLSKLGLSFSMPSKTIASGVKIAGVDVGGFTKGEAIDAVNNVVGESYSSTTLAINVLDQTLEISPAVSGAHLDVEAAVEDAFHYGVDGNPAKTVDILPYLNLDTQQIRNQIRDFSVNFPTAGSEGGYEIVQETVDDANIAVLSITVGSEYYTFNEDALYDVIMTAYSNHHFETVYYCEKLSTTDIDLDAIYAEVCVEPENASWDAQTHEIIEAVVGYRFDLDAAKEALAAANPGEVLKIPFEEIQPEVTTEDLDGALFRDVLGTYTAHQNSSSNRATNLRLACEALDGLILYPGDQFSYNATLGERTPEKGYKEAAAYSGNETVQSYGGGICQPSSALYYCTLMADLEIVQRHCHTFASSYVPMGMDATVDWSGPDLKFRNNTNYPIRIDAEADGGTVTISLVGTDEKDYYVKMEYEVLSTNSWKTVEEEVSADSGHKDGEVKTTPYNGYTVQTYKLKYNKDTDELISREKEAHSVYSKRDKVVYKVKAATTEPTAPSTEPTTPPTTTAPEPTTAPTTAPTEPAPTENVGEAGGDVALPGESG